MKVKDLIEQLSKFDPELPICFDEADYYEGTCKAEEVFLAVEADYLYPMLSVSFNGMPVERKPVEPIQGPLTERAQKHKEQVEGLSFYIESDCRKALEIQNQLYESGQKHYENQHAFEVSK